mmetsp:Transcript_2870/g.5790  ORF Transcript_2870/g.5790 Transcript_2870/m.5790 type:complete len:182 (-) Transcript_2870:105-650(-)|eukprot:CAMPEP_0171629108 /NCGR_PEP_ID=MMETSP0990-20121206/21939_1 /TAXON_ID=483369 /ORGANISM="non described non described, Strain CCMP2098" /LENGTH=181 /DNA_ID=CAMNT_0012197627 /DNA_START=198 /DNA_END=743 /DNA_ORIENTATION=-
MTDKVQESPLPNEWTEHKTKNGRTYYYDSTAKKSSWVRPSNEEVPAANDGSFMEKFRELQKTKEGVSSASSETVEDTVIEATPAEPQAVADPVVTDATDKKAASEHDSSAYATSKRKPDEGELKNDELPASSDTSRPAKSSRFTKSTNKAPTGAATAYLQQVAELKSADPSGGSGGKWLVR